MGITLAGGAQFPSFDGLIGLGRLIITIGLIAQIGIGIGRLFRGAAPEFIPAIVKAALAFFAISSLNQIGAAAHQTGGLLAEAIAGSDRMDGFLASIESTLLATYNPDSGYFDIVTLEFWFGLASVACMGFAFISKFIVLEVLWPLYLGLVVISGTFSISLATLPGMRTAQSWILTLMEAVSWPMIFQILLGIVAVVCDQQVEVMQQADDNFIPLLKGLATLCAVSFLTVMVPILAARMMRGEGASAAMSFVAAKASSLVTGITARAAVGAVAAPAKAAAGPVRAGLGGGARMAASATAGAVAGVASKVADAAPGAALTASLMRRPRPGRAGRAPVQTQGGQPGNSPRSSAKAPFERVAQSGPQSADMNALDVSPEGQTLPQGNASNSAEAAPSVSPPQSAAQAMTRADRLRFNAPTTAKTTTQPAETGRGKVPAASPAPKAWPVQPPPPPLPHIDASPVSPAERAAQRGSTAPNGEPKSAEHNNRGDANAHRPPKADRTPPPFEGQAQGHTAPPPGASKPSAHAAQQGVAARQGATAAPQTSKKTAPRSAPETSHRGTARPAASPSSRQMEHGHAPEQRPDQSPTGRTTQGPARPAPGALAQQHTPATPRSTYRNIKGSTRYSNQVYGQLKQTHPAAAERIKAAWKADPPPPKGPGNEPARQSRRERIDAVTRQIVAELKEPPK